MHSTQSAVARSATVRGVGIVSDLVADVLVQRRRNGRLYPFIHPHLTACVGYRLARRAQTARLPILAYAIAVLAQTVTGAEVNPEADLGPGLCFAHTGGVVIGPRVVAGRGLVVFAGATLGSRGESRSGSAPGYPTLGDDVTVYAKATIMGEITIANGATIGAHALVMTDGPPGGVAAGIPARWT